MKLVLVLLLVWGAWLLLRPKRRLVPDGELAAARAVLGVGRDADTDAIRAAHRRLAASVHPDRGGSAELARQVNAARDLLLRQTK